MNKDELLAWLGKTKTAAHRVVAAHLTQFPMDMRFSDKGLSALMLHHPTKKFKKTSGFTFALCSRPPYYTKSLYVEALTGGLIDCSWKKCIENLYGGYNIDRENKAKKLQALRNDAFKSAKSKEAHEMYGNGGECGVCKKDNKHLDIDHDGKPFALIVDEFLASMRLGLPDLQIEYRNNAFQLRQRAVKKAWRKFHDENAVLKGVCHTCNCSKGSGGYRHGAKAKAAEGDKEGDI